MFTGIIEEVGRIASVEEGDGIRSLRVEADPSFLDGVKPGDSIAVDGACLTPVNVEGEAFTVQVVASTRGRTLAGGYQAGDRVNLERAMQLGARLDGHLVQGHVDGVGRLNSVRREGDTIFLEFRIPREVHRATIPYGSVALNGISLTVNALREPDLLEVAIIPHTWTHTNLSALEPGAGVNVEGDLIGKYVGRLMAPHIPESQETD